MADTELRQAERNFQAETTDENAARLLRQQARSGLTQTKVFLVTLKHYDYDDNYHYPSEGSTVSKVFTDKNRATQEARDRTRQEFLDICTNDLGEWFQEGFDLTPEVTTKLKAIELDPDDEEYQSLTLDDGDDDYYSLNTFGNAISVAHRNNRISDDLLDEIIECTGLEFCSVTEMALEDGICGGIE